MEMNIVWQKVAIMQGAVPYIIAIAMIYASPIENVTLWEGKYWSPKTVNRVNNVNPIQPELY